MARAPLVALIPTAGLCMWLHDRVHIPGPACALAAGHWGELGRSCIEVMV